MRKFCDGCGGLFHWPDDTRSDARYHSSACRQQAYRVRKRVARDPQAALATAIANLAAIIAATSGVTASEVESGGASRNGPGCSG